MTPSPESAMITILLFGELFLASMAVWQAYIMMQQSREIEEMKVKLQLVEVWQAGVMQRTWVRDTDV